MNLEAQPGSQAAERSLEACTDRLQQQQQRIVELEQQVQQSNNEKTAAQQEHKTELLLLQKELEQVQQQLNREKEVQCLQCVCERCRGFRIPGIVAFVPSHRPAIFEPETLGIPLLRMLDVTEFGPIIQQGQSAPPHR